MPDVSANRRARISARDRKERAAVQIDEFYEEITPVEGKRPVHFCVHG